MSVIIFEIIDLMEEYAPLGIAESWDNVGLIIGSRKNIVSNILVALDGTFDVLKEAKEKNCDFLITHHPFIFSSINKIDFETSEGKNIEYAIKNNISVYSAHTNLDRTYGGVNDILAEMTGLNNIKITKDINGKNSYIRYGLLSETTTLRELSSSLKTKLDSSFVCIVGDPKKEIKKAAVVGGSGGSFIDEAHSLGADVLITGDIKYHQAQRAIDLGICIIDISHYDGEKFIVDKICNYLNEKKAVKNLSYNVFKSEINPQPFSIII